MKCAEYHQRFYDIRRIRFCLEQAPRQLTHLMPESGFKPSHRDTAQGDNMDSTISKEELYTEKLMNMILDVIDDIIIIHDSCHTIIWMNKAAETAFGKSADEVIGKKCYSLFGNTVSCSDCTVNQMNVGSPQNATRRRVIPGTNVVCDCSSIPYYEDGKLKLVVQHLRPLKVIET